MTLKANVLARISAEKTNGDALWTPRQQKALALTDGTGIGQADRVYEAEHTIASGANLDLDLAGGVLDRFGATITFAEIVALQVINEAEDGTQNVTDITIGGGSNPFDGFWGTAGDQIVLPPGGYCQVGCSGASGIGAVVAATGDVLRIANAAGAPAKVQVMILGRSA